MTPSPTTHRLSAIRSKLPLVLAFPLVAAPAAGVTNDPSGAAHYERLCASCHGSDGRASAGEGPPLAGASWVSGSEITLIRIVMHGVRGPIRVGDEIYDREMPGFGGKLSDEEMASLLSFIRHRWGGAPVGAESVGRIRAAAGNRTHYWTVKELLETP